MFFKIILEAFNGVFNNTGVLAKRLLIPFLAYLAIFIAVTFFPDPRIAFGLGLLNSWIMVIFIITTHRIVLLGPGFVPEWGLLKCTKRELIYAGHLIGLGLLFSLAAGTGVLATKLFGAGLIYLIPAVIWIITLVVVLASAYSRLSLVFPAIAIDQKISFKEAWELSKGFEGILILLIVVFPFLCLIPMVFFIAQGSMLLLQLYPDQFKLIQLLSDLTSLMGTIFFTAVLSISYKYISDEKNKTPSLESPEGHA